MLWDLSKIPGQDQILNNRPDYCIGIEGIGLSKTIAVLSKPDGTILGASSRPVGLSLFVTPRQEFRSELFGLLKDLAEETELSLEAFSRACVCFGLNGSTYSYSRDIELMSELEKIKIKFGSIIIIHDLESAFISHAQSDTGLAVLCSCDSAYLGMNKGVSKYGGGWGPALGDHGSGYMMGLAALRSVLRRYHFDSDARALWEDIDRWYSDPTPRLTSKVGDWEEASMLWRQIRNRAQPQKHQSTRPDFLLSFAYEVARDVYSLRRWRSIVSSLTNPVIKASDAGNFLAERIVEKTARKLSDGFEIFLRSTTFEISPISLVLYGGVVTHNETFCNRLKKDLGKVVHQVLGQRPQIITLHDPGTMRPAIGCLMVALGGAGPGGVSLPCQTTLDAVKLSISGSGLEVLGND